MHFFPGIYEGKRTKKATSFSNPLTGAFFSNKDYLVNCRNVPRSISDLDHIKQIKHNSYHQQIPDAVKTATQRKRMNSKQERKRIQRQIVAVHATARMAVNKVENQSFMMSKRCQKALDEHTIEQLEKLKLNKTFTSNNQMTKMKNYKVQQSRVSDHLNNNGVQFENIQILILNLLEFKEDIGKKIIKINMQKYFRSFFKKQLSGHFTVQFLEKVQQYVEKMYMAGKLDDPIDQQMYPIELFTINTRLSFMNRLEQLEMKKTMTNEQYISVLIRHYCVPSKEFRQSCLRDILLMLSLELYQKWNCSRHQNYVLLNEDGIQIQDILQIKFSTKKLFLSNKQHSHKNYQNYLKLLDEFYREGKKLTFNENIKLNFRHRLAQGNFDDSHFNYTENYEMENLKRKIQLSNAQKMLKKRTQTHRVCKFFSKNETLYHTQKPTSRNGRTNPFQNTQKQTLSSSVNETIQKTAPEAFHHWKVQTGRISPTSRKSRSRSPQRTKSPTKSISTIRRDAELNKQKLKQFLTEGKTRILNADLQQSFRDQFKDLVFKNDVIDLSFNHKFKNRVLKSVLGEFFAYFKDKSENQVSKIFSSIKAMKIDTKIQLNEYHEKQQDADLQSDRQVIESLSWQQFKSMKTIIGCMQPKQHIMSFIAKYLNFNQFGQLSKAQLFYQIEVCLGQNCQSSIVQVIAEVIWSWFEANGIIENGFIRRITLQSWYEKYKIVYCMLISLIFGTNHKTILDLAYEILV